MTRTVLVLSSFSLLYGGSPGIRPRASADDYTAHQSNGQGIIAAAIVPARDVKKIFATDLNKGGYIVIEVGVFPAPGKEIDLSPMDFTLNVDANSIAERPADADAIAARLQKKQSPPQPARPGDVYTSAGTSIGHGTWTDPVTGRRSSGTITETSAGVGVGAPAPMPCRTINCDERMPMPDPPVTSGPRAGQMEQELWEKSLPDGKTTRAVAGYLYFPKPSSKSKNATWELRWDNASDRLKISLTNVSGH